MNTKTLHHIAAKSLGLLALAGASCLILTQAPLPSMAGTGNGVQTRPIMDFVEAQGTYCIDDGMGGCFLFVPPIANFFGWADPERQLFASVDYAGLADLWLLEETEGCDSFGTTFSGTVQERALGDGRTEVKVVLHTKNALVWVAEPVPDDPDANPFTSGPLVFGAKAPEVCDLGIPPSLGDSLFKVRFIHEAEPGDPLPDLMSVFGGEIELLELDLHAQASGFLANGVTEATVKIDQVGLDFSKTFNPDSSAGDYFPTEKIVIKAR